MSAILDEARRLSGGMALRYDRHSRGGEYDAIRSLPRRTRNVLKGAGLLVGARRGEQPDTFADCLRSHGAGWDGMTDGDAVLRWVGLVLAGLEERRAERRRYRRARLARAALCDSEYDYRTMQAIGAGFRTFWQYRQARGWAS